MVEIAVVVGVGLVALGAILLAVKLVKAALRAVVVVCVLAAVVAVGATWGRPTLVEAWDRLTSYGTKRKPKSASGAMSKTMSQIEENAKVRRAIQAEFELQDKKSSDNDLRAFPPHALQPLPKTNLKRRSSSKYRVR